MAEHAPYEFKNPVARWLDERLPILSFTKVHLLDYPTPRNLNYFWTFGAILAVMLVVQIVTGIVLAMHFTPHVDFAFDSIEEIMPRRELRLHHPVHALRSARRCSSSPSTSTSFAAFITAPTRRRARCCG